METVVPTGLGYSMVDADSHFYEPYDCFTRHIEPEFAERAVHVVNPGGPGVVHIGSEPLKFVSQWVTDSVMPPGSLREMLIGEYEAETAYVAPDAVSAWDHPEWVDRDRRLELMDAQGIQATLLLGTLNVNAQYELLDDLESAYANWRSFNKWLYEDWGYSHKNRVFGAPVVMLADIDKSVAELDRVLALGARVVALMAGPADGRSPGDRYFDPFWARLQEAGVPAAFHIGDSGYSERISTLFGQKPRPAFREMTALQFYLGFGTRPIVDTLAALVLGDTFGRFPDLKVLSLENGSTWVRQLLHDLDHAAKFARRAETLSALPSDMFRNNVYVAPFFEESGYELAELIGADHVLFGSDFPHPEGPAEPIEFVQNLGSMPTDEIRLVMRENTARLLRLDPENP